MRAYITISKTRVVCGIVHTACSGSDVVLLAVGLKAVVLVEELKN